MTVASIHLTCLNLEVNQGKVICCMILMQHMLPIQRKYSLVNAFFNEKKCAKRMIAEVDFVFTLTLIPSMDIELYLCSNEYIRLPVPF